jgi:hypothetical protein
MRVFGLGFTALSQRGTRERIQDSGERKEEEEVEDREGPENHG